MQTIQTAILSLDVMSERGRPSLYRADVRELIVPFGSAGYVIEYRVEASRVLVARVFHSREAR